MSFGFSIGDIILLTQLTTRAYNGWKTACGNYAGITCDLAVLQTLLLRIHAEVEAPNSLFAQYPDDIRGWETISRSCLLVVKELENVVKKYKSLSTSRRKNWDRIRMGNTNLEGLSVQLTKRLASLAAFASVLGISSQGRLQTEAFPKLLEKVDSLAARLRKGDGTVSTALSGYENDDKDIWREFRRDMIISGIRSSDIRKYSPALKTYITRLQREGLLVEEIPVTPNKDSVVDTNQEEPCLSIRKSFVILNKDESKRTLPLIQNSPDRQSKTAEELAIAELEDQGELHVTDHLETIDAMQKRSNIYWEQYRWEEAAVMERQLVAMRIKILGPEHPDTLTTMYNFGRTLSLSGQLKKAEENQRDLMQSQSRVLGAEHRSTLNTMHSLARNYQQQKRVDEAQKLAQQVLKSQQKVLGEKHQNTLWTMHLLASIYQNQGQLTKAEELAKQTLAITKQVLGAVHIYTLEIVELLSLVYRDQGRLQEAEELGKQIFEGYKKNSGLNHFWTLNAMHNLASIIRAQGRIQEATSLLANCLYIQGKLPAQTQFNREAILKDINRWKDEEKLSKKSQKYNAVQQ